MKATSFELSITRREISRARGAISQFWKCVSVNLSLFFPKKWAGGERLAICAWQRPTAQKANMREVAPFVTCILDFLLWSSILFSVFMLFFRTERWNCMTFAYSGKYKRKKK